MHAQAQANMLSLASVWASTHKVASCCAVLWHAVPCCVVLWCAVQALVDVLQQGGCSELISLDLRGNSLSPEAEALLVS
jgi:hypothetical protein